MTGVETASTAPKASSGARASLSDKILGRIVISSSFAPPGVGTRVKVLAANAKDALCVGSIYGLQAACQQQPSKLPKPLNVRRPKREECQEIAKLLSFFCC